LFFFIGRVCRYKYTNVVVVVVGTVKTTRKKHLQSQGLTDVVQWSGFLTTMQWCTSSATIITSSKLNNQASSVR